MSAPDSPGIYKITFEKRSAYLYAYVEGEHDSYTISRAYWQEVADEAARVGMRRILIDENIVESVTVAEVFLLASEIPRWVLARLALPWLIVI